MLFYLSIKFKHKYIMNYLFFLIHETKNFKEQNILNYDIFFQILYFNKKIYQHISLTSTYITEPTQNICVTIKLIFRLINTSVALKVNIHKR